MYLFNDKSLTTIYDTDKLVTLNSKLQTQVNSIFRRIYSSTPTESITIIKAKNI